MFFDVTGEEIGLSLGALLSVKISVLSAGRDGSKSVSGGVLSCGGIWVLISALSSLTRALFSAGRVLSLMVTGADTGRTLGTSGSDVAWLDSGIISREMIATDTAR